MTAEPDYHCPLCGTLSELVISEIQAFCTNEESCNVIAFNPSLPDGGMNQVHVVRWDEDR